MDQKFLKQCVAEFVGTFTLIFIGVGAIHNNPRLLGVALASGHWNNQIPYWIGPMLGGDVAGLVYGRFLIKDGQ